MEFAQGRWPEPPRARGPRGPVIDVNNGNEFRIATLPGPPRVPKKNLPHLLTGTRIYEPDILFQNYLRYLRMSINAGPRTETGFPVHDQQYVRFFIPSKGTTRQDVHLALFYHGAGYFRLYPTTNDFTAAGEHINMAPGVPIQTLNVTIKKWLEVPKNCRYGERCGRSCLKPGGVCNKPYPLAEGGEYIQCSARSEPCGKNCIPIGANCHQPARNTFPDMGDPNVPWYWPLEYYRHGLEARARALAPGLRAGMQEFLNTHPTMGIYWNWSVERNFPTDDRGPDINLPPPPPPSPDRGGNNNTGTPGTPGTGVGGTNTVTP